MSGKRGMTEGEIELARSVYGDSIDYSEVEIHDHSYALTPGQVSAPNGDIYYPEGRYQDDFSEGGLGARKTFIHELGHVLQDQNGIDVLTQVPWENLTGGHLRGDYDWEDKFKAGTSFHEWDLEEQAEFFGDLYRAREDGTVPDGITKEQMETYFDSLDLKKSTHQAENSYQNSQENEVRFADENSAESDFSEAIANRGATDQMPIQTFVENVAAGQKEMEALWQGGTPSLAHQAVNHPDFGQLIKSLVENDVESVNVQISPDMDIDAQMSAYVLAGEEAAQDAGISRATYSTDAGHQMASNTGDRSPVLTTEEAYEYDV